MQFQYDPSHQVGRDDFLTPVFFRPGVLVRYFYDPRYRCDFCSPTYATIRFPDGAYLSIGLNHEDLVIAWLGDLRELPPTEQQALVLENVLSGTGDIASDFKRAQLVAEFTEPVPEARVLLAKSAVAEKCISRFGFSPFKTHGQDIKAAFDACSRYARVMFGSKDDIKRFISELNEEIVEDIDIPALRSWLAANGHDDLKGLGGLKLLQRFVESQLVSEGNPIGPLFILYDFRLWADHKDADSKLRTVKERLGLGADTLLLEVYTALVREMDGAFADLSTAAAAQPSSQ